MDPMTEPLRRRMLTLLLGEALCLPARPASATRPVLPLFVGTGRSAQASSMLTWLAAQMDVEWDFRPTPWLRAQKLAAAGEGLMYGLSRTAQREKELLFSLPVWSNHTWAIVRDGAQAEIRRYADLSGQFVCWARGSSYGDLFTAAGLGRMRGIESADDDGALSMVGAGRCRAALLTLEAGKADQALRHPALKDLRALGLALVPKPVAETPLHFVTGLDSRWAWAITRINQVVSRSHQELERIRQG